MNDRRTNAENPTRYTAVFEFEGQPPAVHVNCGWLGGRLVAVSFCDELARIDFADALLAAAGEPVSIVDQPVSRVEYDRQVARAEAAEAANKNLLYALRYYANPLVWKESYDGTYDCSWASTELDKGNIARAAIAVLPSPPKAESKGE